MTEAKPGLSRVAKVALAVLGLGALCVPCGGAAMMIGMPAFLRYQRRAMAAEAHLGLSDLQESVDRLAGLPPSIPWTPGLEGLGATARAFPLDARWQELDFSPAAPVRYSYAVTSDLLAQTVRIEITGDLDEDGVRSSFFRTGRLDPARALTHRSPIAWDDVIVLDELE